MRALCWHGKHDVRVNTVPDPIIQEPTDVIIKITTTAICGSDLHIYGGFVVEMHEGDILGHEFMGIVEEVGAQVTKLKKGDRVVVPFTISCGKCFFCQRDLWSLCDTTNPDAEKAAKLLGSSPAALFGYSHLFGGFPGGQAQYVRVPHADVGPLIIPGNLPDEQVLFLSDIFPTGYMAAENANIQPGDTVAVWGCGPVGQFTIKSAYMLGAGRVIAIDRVPERLEMARTHGKAEVINYEDEKHLMARLYDMTEGRGPDSCIDAVGMEAHGTGLQHFYDRTKQALMLETDRPQVLREAVYACRKGGTVSVPGVYVGMIDKFPMGLVMNKGLTIKSGQTHMHKYMKPLLDRIESAAIDPGFVITHRLSLEDAPDAYKTFRDKKDGCIKVVLKPNG
jgi:threonine dehydrogenase-like Zn-dependent dehydrogenase